MTDEEAFKKRVRVVRVSEALSWHVVEAYVGFAASRDEVASRAIGSELIKSGAIITDVRHDEKRHQQITTRTLAVVMPKNEDGSAGYDFAEQITEQREAAVHQVAELIRAEAANVDKTDWLVDRAGTSAELRALAMRIDLAADNIARDWRNVE
jgi:hypothetical protein